MGNYFSATELDHNGGLVKVDRSQDLETVFVRFDGGGKSFMADLSREEALNLAHALNEAVNG